MGIHFVGGPIPAKSVMQVQFLGPASLRPMTPEEEAFRHLLEDMAHLGDQDQWWLDRRLGGELVNLHDPRGKLSDNQLSTYLKAFQSAFDNAWWRSVCQRHRRIKSPDPLGFFGGQDPLFRILRLGECIHTFGGLEALPAELINRLKNPSQHYQTATELDIASCFRQAGLPVEMYPVVASGKCPEGRVVIDSQVIYYEVTEESWAALNRDVFKAEKLLNDWFSKALGPVNGMIHFYPSDSPAVPRARSAVAIMKQQFSKATLPAAYKGEAFEARFESSGGLGGWVGISGLEPEPSWIVSQWIKRVVDKGKQLPPGEAGVIVGSPLFLWGTRECEAANRALVDVLTKQPHTRISGIIFHAKHVENSGFIKHIPSVVINPRAKGRCDEALAKLAQALFIYPDWM